MTGSVRRGTIAGVAAVAAALMPVAHGLAAERGGAVQAFRGHPEGMRWGPVRATILVRGGKMFDVKVNVSGDIVRSTFITRRAIPELRRETLAAQSVYIDVVSGATQTSEAYIASLSSAIRLAQQHKALR
jgi:hypothetical protein